MAQFHEPPVDPQEDTSPSLAVRPRAWEARLAGRTSQPNVARWVGAASLLGAFLITAGALLLLVLPVPEAPPAPPVVAQGDLATAQDDLATAQDDLATAQGDLATAQATGNAPLPTLAATQAVQVLRPDDARLPTLDTRTLAQLLQRPPVQVGTPNPAQSLRYDPFTLIPERPRSEFIEYTAVSGDTIDGIAKRYGLKAESIAWCNDRRIVFVLRPGDVLRIPPVDGACHLVLGTRNETIASIAQQYKVEPQKLANSPYSNFANLGINDVLPGGLSVFIEGGQGELITWNVKSDVQKDESGRIRSISFATGQRGSCGPVDPGGGVAWGNPLPNGTWVRGFSVGHTGIDLSAPVGTPIYAANSGPVLFSGFSNWGYGETVVLAHGPFSTLYAHMTTRNVACGQFVTVGQVVGTVGSTGNSTGPHLHFEIRYNDTPQNPSGTPGIGW